jgi:8-oxo-dGTP pyrophosphatase MutT (NUDIX family)
MLRQAGKRRRLGKPGPGQLTIAAEIAMEEPEAVPEEWTMRALAGCVVMDESARILLIHRHGSRAQWELPGGKVEEGESSEGAARRELQEELGIWVSSCRELGDTSFREHTDAWRYTWYLAEKMTGCPELREPERFDDLQYFPMGDLPMMMNELSPNVRQLVRSYFEGLLTLPAPAGLTAGVR